MFRLKVLLLFALVFVGLLSNAQTGGQVAFLEKFLNNNNRWPIQAGPNYNFSFQDRKYDMNSSREGMITPVVYTEFDHNKEYTISCTILHLSGPDNNAYGLTFAYKNSGTSYQFEIATQGYYRLLSIRDNAVTHVIPWTQSDAIKTENGQANDLKIWKKGNGCDLYINEILINHFDDFKNEGDYTGFVIENTQHLAASTLIIEYH